jgi:uncharacterized protein YegP (UPF0339 family)
MFVEVFKGKGKQPWYVRLKSHNGKTIVVSEGYSSKATALSTAAKVFCGLEVREVE